MCVYLGDRERENNTIQALKEWMKHCVIELKAIYH